jgi:peptidoglycan/LPS O-acetylase OafA/YrhL
MNAPVTDPPPVRHQRTPAPGLWSERYDLIDAWRGLAALAVVVHHVAFINIGGPAVMLFFVISGYCIAASVDSCQRRGLGFGKFMMRRVRRIYPPYLLSIAFWAATRYVKLKTGGGNDFAKFTALDWVQNLTLTQWLNLLTDPLSSAAMNKTLFVAAYWSLCYEEQFYLLMGLMMIAAAFAGLSVRAMAIGIMAIGLVWNVLVPERTYGLFIEYWAMFCFGLLVFHRLCRMDRPVHRRMVDLGLVAVLVGSLIMRYTGNWAADDPKLPTEKAMELRVVYGELAMSSGFALLLIAMRPLSERIAAVKPYRPLAWLGHITFSLYLIHQFNLQFVNRAVAKVLGPIAHYDASIPASEQPWFALVVQICGHIAIASVFWYFCERPFLNKSLLPVTIKPPADKPSA